MNAKHRGARACGLAVAFGAAGCGISPARAEDPGRDDAACRLEVTSGAFTDGGTLPLSTVDNFVVNNLNTCTADGSAGGNQSAPLS